MKPYLFTSIRWTFLLSVCLFMTLLLSACDLFGGSATAKPTPTPVKSNPTATTAPALVAYTGDGYTISYPQGWKVTEDANFEGGKGKAVHFTDSLGLTTFAVEDAANPNDLASTSTLLDLGVAAFKKNAKNYQEVTLTPKTTVSGQSWDQRAATADVTVSGVTANTKQVALATNYPANSLKTKVYGIIYATATLNFDIANPTVFQPMIQSFKFTA